MAALISGLAPAATRLAGKALEQAAAAPAGGQAGLEDTVATSGAAAAPEAAAKTQRSQRRPRRSRGTVSAPACRG